jgi:hypothetical protein
MWGEENEEEDEMLGGLNFVLCCLYFALSLFAIVLPTFMDLSSKMEKRATTNKQILNSRSL